MAIPTITTNRLILLEGQTVEVFTDDLNATVEGTEVPSSAIVFTIEFDSEAALAGDFLLEGSADPVFSFTLEDVEQNRVSFRHDRSNNAPDYRVVAAATVDGVTESSTADPAAVSFTATNDAPRITTNVLAIAEGATITLDSSNLQATDEAGESTAEELTYTLKSVSANGQFLRVEDGVTTALAADDPTTPEVEANSQFTQADINSGLIQFAHDGSETPPSYTVTVTDSGVPGTGPAFDPITTNANTVRVQSFVPVNDAPEITKNTISLTEGGIVQIGTNNLAATDVEDPDETLTFTVTSITGGRFELVEDGQTTVLASPTTEPVAFTQDKIFQGLVRFVNDPATDEPPTYTIEVTDDGTPAPAATDSSEAVVTFTAVNDIPTLETLALTIEEGEQVTLSDANLLVLDEESAAEGLTYQVTSVTSGSFIRLSDGLPTDAFTQAEINAGNVIAFVHDGSTAPPSFSLTVTDEGGESIVIDSGDNIDFGPFNDLPNVVRAQLSVTENGIVRLSSANNLLATDEESSSGQLLYTVTIENADATKPDSFIVAGTVQTGPTVTFTQAQVGAGQVQFVQGGSNSAPNLTVTLTDSAIVEDGVVVAEANTIPVDFAVNFTAINDEPRFLTNTLSIEEGGTVVLNTATTNLQSDDEETPAAELIYTINSVSNGEFQRLDTAEVTPLAVGDTFTQADVDQGFIQFVHDGSEAAPDYQLTVSDTGINDDPSTVLSVARDLTIPEGGFTNVNDAPTLVNNTLTLTEGDTVFLTLDNLSATDPEDDNADLVFTITEVTSGRFERVTIVDGVEVVETLASPELETPVSFTQAEVEQRLIRFVNDPATNEAPTYTVEVSDLDADPLTASEPATVQFTAVDDEPELQTLSFALTEGETLPLTAAELSVVDEETPPEGVIYTVDTVTGGSFVLVADGSPADTFTQADLNAGNVIEFQHDGLNDAPTFSLTVTDGTNEITVTETLEDGVSFTPTNDAPMVEVSAFTVAEGETVTLSGVDDLRTVDEESPSSELVYTVEIANNDSDNPDGFLVDGELLTGPEVTFTQAQVNAGQVAFVHGGSNNAPTLTMTVTDGAIAEGDTPNTVPVPLEVDFIPSNDEPNFLVNTLAIAEGGTVVLNAGDTPNLASTDEESTAEQLTYTVDSVINGEFQRTDTTEPTPIPVGGTFTQAEVDAGLIQFVHDGSEFAPDYTLTVSDAGILDDPATILSVQRDLTIPEGGFANVNDPPEIGNNTLTLTEGETIVLTPDDLSATDAEDEDANLVFTITEVTNGRFERVTDVEGEAVVEVLAAPDLETPVSFTQAEIEQGLIRFVNDPATDEPPTYTVQVSDLDADDPQTTSAPGNVDFTIVNDAPELQLLSLTLTEGDTVPLTDAVLSVVDEETLPEGITYTVDTVTGGSFVLAADGTPADTFTQADLIAGNVVEFQHDGSNDAPTFSLTASDGVNEITITDESDAGVSFTPTNDTPAIAANEFSVTEGGSVLLSGVDNLLTEDEESSPEELTYTVTVNNADPDNPDGFLIGEEFVTGEVTFTQAQVDAGLVTFVHGGSNFAPDVTATVTDTFPPELGEPITIDVGLTVGFTAINDVPEVVNNALIISEGETLTLTSENLLTEDEETPPEELTYTVDAVVNGEFQRFDAASETATPIALGATFTQAEVNAGAIQFVHNGDEAAPSYTLTVTDTALEPEGEANSVTFDAVIPEGGFTNINDAPTLTANTLSITEGGTVVLTAANLAATDPDSVLSRLRFSISGVEGGTFFLDGAELTEGTTFNPAAIAFGELSFVDNGDDVPPLYTITVQDPQGDSTTAPATIVFEAVNDAPEITTNTFTFTEGRRLTLNDPDTGVVNLAAIDSESGTDLTYEVTNVEGGAFFDFQANPVSTFTQTELDQGDIIFVHDGSEMVPSFTINVTDPDGATTAVEANVVELIPVNDPPVLETAQLTVTEGETIILTPENFSATDVDSPDEALTFLISNLEGGQFVMVNGEGGLLDSPSGTFTGTLELTEEQVATALADGLYINLHTQNFPNGELRGQIDLEAEGVTATGVLEEVQEVDTVPDTPATGTFEATLVGNVLTLSGSYSDLSSPLQLVGGEDAVGNPESAIHVHVGAAGTNGPILQNLLVEEMSTGEGLTSFTQAQVAAGEIAFIDDGDQVAPTFDVSVSDGDFETDAVPVEIVDFINVNDPPTANPDSGEGFGTDEQSAFVTPSVLENDVDPDPEDTFSITQVNGEDITAGDVAIASGAIVSLAGDGTFEYDPNGQFVGLAEGEVVTDSFEYTISDAAGATSTATVTIEVTGINDAPTLTTNRLIISKGETQVLTANNVLATDPDTAAAELVFTTSNVTGGQFVLNGEATDSFTQQDILEGNVSFVQDGGEVAPTYSLTVSDGFETLPPSAVNVERFIPVDIEAINGGMFDYEQFLRLQNLDAVIPTDEVTNLPVPQFFDEQYYLATNPDVAAGVAAGNLPSGYAHFVQYGRFEGRNPSILYNEEYYLDINTDVARAVANGNLANGLQHFLNVGVVELRVSSPSFNQQVYLDENGDVLDAVRQGIFNSGFEHYIEAGANELRDPQLFLFNEAYYLANNSDVAAAVNDGQYIDGYAHFVSFGQGEGRSPSILFDETSYLALNPDVADAVSAGLLPSGFSHYAQYGRFEGREVFI